MTRDGHGDVVGWPAEVAARYRAAGCWRGEPIGARLWSWARRRGERVAVVDGPVALSYRELALRADALAVELAALGLRHGDRVLVQLPNCWEFVVVTLACLRAGVVPVMLLPPHRDHELGAIGAHVRARAIVVPDVWKGYDHEALAHRVAATLPDPAQVLVVGDRVGPESVDVRGLIKQEGDVAARRAWLDAHPPAPADPAVFLLSGGTTGVPKVIARTHDDYDYNIRRVVEACAVDAGSVYLAVLPAGHNFALANPGILGTLYAGGRVVLLPSPRPDAVFAAIERERVTLTSAVPAVALAWAAAAEHTAADLSSLRHLHVGGATLAPEVAARIGPALGCRLQQVYGMAEGLICYTAPDAPPHVAHGTQGRPISPLDELRVVGPDGTPVPPGAVGELLTRGPYTPRGYVGVPATNAVAFTPDGWYRTGDLVRLTADGNVVVCGRVKDLINRGGEKISAAEVEALAQELPQVAEAAAFPVPDPLLGERVALAVRLRPGAELALPALAAALTARGLAAFKVPERLVVLAELPHTPVGKPDRAALAARVTRS